MKNLVNILEKCKPGTLFYSPLYGYVELYNIVVNSKYPICVLDKNKTQRFFMAEGKVNELDGECLLFPSKTNRDWDNFNQEDLRFDPKTLNPFDKVLVRDDNNYQWSCSLFSHVSTDDNTFDVVTLDGCTNYQTIPYNDETKHLLGTKDSAPQFYRYWED